MFVLPEKATITETKRKEREKMKRTTGHLTEKNKKWYAVINLYDWTNVNKVDKKKVKN